MLCASLPGKGGNEEARSEKNEIIQPRNGQDILVMRWSFPTKFKAGVNSQGEKGGRTQDKLYHQSH